MDQSTKDEIAVAVSLALASESEEHAAMVERVAQQVIDLTAKVTLIETEVLAMIARNASVVSTVAEIKAEARRIADESKAEALAAVTASNAQVGARMQSFATELAAVTASSAAALEAVGALKENIEQTVLVALKKHTTKIEDAANKLASAPQVKTATALAGTFAGSAAVAAGVEVLKAFHIL